MTGLTVVAGAGVDAWAGALSNRIRPGPGWSVLADIKPTRILGIELGYTGAAQDVATARGGGPEIVRNGGQAALTVGLTASHIQPYVLGGVGIDSYNVRGSSTNGFVNDTAGAVPVGGGIRGYWGHFTTDIRGAYDFTFNNQFAAGAGAIDVAGASISNAGRYNATLNLGGTF
jgi:hypothetical protein